MRERISVTACVVAALWTVAGGGAAAQDTPLYSNDFQAVAPGSLPADFLVLDGGFAVREDGGAKFIELPGAPLESFGLLFGPTQADGLAVAAKIYGTGAGRRFPTFGVGLAGATGFRLQVVPGKKALELLRGDVVRASCPFAWSSGAWTHLKLQVRQLGDGRWSVEGTASTNAAAMRSWSLRVEETEKPIAGRASLWGSPFSGTPIRFDDLVISRAADKL
jgi:hypothetical protein